MSDVDLRAIRTQLTELLTLQLPEPLPVEEADVTDLEGYVRQMFAFVDACEETVPAQYRSGSASNQIWQTRSSLQHFPSSWHTQLRLAEKAYDAAVETRTACAVDLAAVEHALAIAGGPL